MIAEAVLAERAAIREAPASVMVMPGTNPESADVTRISERLQAGESPVAIARESRAISEPGPGPTPTKWGATRLSWTFLHRVTFD